jgi:hypothetical protein
MAGEVDPHYPGDEFLENGPVWHDRVSPNQLPLNPYELASRFVTNSLKAKITACGSKRMTFLEIRMEGINPSRAQREIVLALTKTILPISALETSIDALLEKWDATRLYST